MCECADVCIYLYLYMGEYVRICACERTLCSQPGSVILQMPAVCEGLMDVWSGVVSLSRMRNEPCFASETFGLIDYKQRPFNMQGYCLLTMQHSFTDEITHIAREKTPCFLSTAYCLLNYSYAVIKLPFSPSESNKAA